MNLEEILQSYTKGEKTLEDTNEALREGGFGLYLDPARNTLSEEELAQTAAGDLPGEANGWGLMDHGFSVMEKVRVVNGRTVDVDMGAELAFVYMAGKKYRLKGNVLEDVSQEG